MARPEVRILKYTKLGLVASVLACGAGLAALVFILIKWMPEEGMIDAGYVAKPLIILALLGCIACGVPGLFLSLEGAASLEGKWQKLGWLGFWVGAGSTMLGLTLGLVFHFYKF